MLTIHSLEDLKSFQNEAVAFFASELMLLKEVIPLIVDERLEKPSVLLVSCGRTGAALLQLINQPQSFNRESVMLARAFMETITNFCYVGICNEKEYRAFILHPIYKQFHNINIPKMSDDLDSTRENQKIRKAKQNKFKAIPIVQEALLTFSETKANLNWTKKTLNERIDAIIKWGKVMDVFFTLNKLQFYSDASESLHGSLYGCTYEFGIFDPEFDNTNIEELEKKRYKDTTCILLHLGMLIHETFTLIKYSNDISFYWKHSYENRGQGLNLLMHVLEVKLNKK